MSERAEFERYQAFMVGYVKRLNEATLNVTIGGVRIGTAKYTRLAQINLRTRIITFSRFAIENVPERGRRYLVLHELAHVKEANHNKRFWEIVRWFEPDYRRIGHQLDQAFKKNVREDQHKRLADSKKSTILRSANDGVDLLSRNSLMGYDIRMAQDLRTPIEPDDEEFDDSESFECMEGDFDPWDDNANGVMQGGSELDEESDAPTGESPWQSVST